MILKVEQLCWLKDSIPQSFLQLLHPLYSSSAMFPEPCRRSSLWVSIQQSLILITLTIWSYLSAVITVYCKKKMLWPGVTGEVILGHRHNYLEGNFGRYSISNQQNKTSDLLLSSTSSPNIGFLPHLWY